jgi:hypothetical protein
MAERFQYARADGTPDWSVGNADFDHVWDNVFDQLRFHRGQHFTVANVSDKKPPVEMALKDVHDFLKPKLTGLPLDTKFRVESIRDGFAMLMRKHLVDTDKGGLILAHEKNKIGTPYVFGVTDCSWLTMFAYGLEGIELPHNAHLQHLDAQVKPITREQIKPGDLLFHHQDQHVSTYLGTGFAGLECVIDTEPSDTTAPSGWPSSNLKTGVQVRPMTGNYYCSWQWVNGIGRIVAINGAP